ncbi:TPA: XRE family transcriptional regulator [Pseudomonas aeruginosa]|uniref:XRE family transcriptional regulator n=3 Tax=Pseudomonas TaxID=286 RepID=UPI0011981D7C|nr:XRE family transcriptional regulator [Pseudomonas aeruginosa]EJN6724084.1 XRE family transcriptional regulator [Pseudomonas aeruginosa]MBW6176464.1 helix-turn-helix domain-containing protein [Pseudomonas aeruginosa]MBW6216282.1 helix-turn-helix domain-containing protein [Pseudomonas aeruginosa]HBO3182669.1 XRE family transcriptional regulator [Pseudomonas aeruginosa]HBO6947084.1 XRE family transcriptional regulator [Pseudomonas aeruginosa]
MIEEGSKNLYADLGCADADAMQRKAMLVMRISDVISAKALGQAQASGLMGIEVFCLEAWLKGHFRDADETVLHACLHRLEIQPH